MTDTRDDQTYKWTQIGDQVWMAENLNFGTRIAASADQKDATASGAEKYCYDDDELSCDNYGGLYQWHSAMALPYSCNISTGCAVTSPHRGICPEGWHVPTQAEWTTLNSWVDENNGGESGDAGNSLKSTTGWHNNGNGIDSYSWNGLPVGYRVVGGFHEQSFLGVWWSTSELSADYAGNRYLYYDFDDFHEDTYDKCYFGFSVRCVKD